MKQDKPRTRIVNKCKDSITLDFKGDIGKVTTTWEEFNSIYEIVDRIWAVPNDNAWKKIQEDQEKVEKVLEKATITAILADKASDPRKKLGYMATLGGTPDEIVNILGCSKEDALGLIQKRLVEIRKLKL